MIIKSNDTSSIKLKVVTDMERGKETYSVVTFSGISSEVSDDNFMALADALAAVQTYPVKSVTRINTYKLVTE